MTLLARSTLIILAGCLSAAPALALQAGVSGVYRNFGTHAKFEDRLFTSGDHGYGGALSLRDEKGYWELGVLYVDKPGDDSLDNDYAIDPFLNMVLKKQWFVFGAGVDNPYVEGPDNGWEDLYWHLLTGLEVPFGKNLSFTGLAIYDFDRLAHVDEFEFDDVEFSAAVNLLF